MGNKERKRKRGPVGKIPVVVREHPIWGDMSRNRDVVEEVQVEPVECPQCHKPFKDVGSFIHHMWVMHEWQSTDSLIYWGNNYGVIESAEKEV